jgi:hypothetical protein
MFRRLLTRRTAAPLAALLLSAAVPLALVAALTLSAPARAADPEPPDAPPAATPEATAAEAPFNPFPASDTMTSTMQLVLDQYLARDGAPMQPMQLYNETEFNPLIRIPAVYLPAVMYQRDQQAPPTVTPTPRPRSRADIAVTVWPEPSIYVARGGRVVYELRVKNYDRGSASTVRVTLPYDRGQMRPVASSFDRKKGDWVSRLTDNEVTVTFGPVARDEYRTGRLVFEVNTTLPNDTVLDLRPRYEWVDERGDHGDYLTNWAPVLVGNGPATAPWVWTQVTPGSGPVGTVHTFVSNRFTPGEGIITWLNTPRGVQSLDLRGTVDSRGNVALEFASTDLRPGTYQLVMFGARSNLTGVATFVVR